MNRPASATSAIILCAEDEPDLLRDMTEELTDAGHEVIGAINGVDAIRALRLRRPDLILCDIDMPLLDGFGLLDAVRAMGPEHAAIPFVFLTALSAPHQVVRGKRLGADDYLVKPIDYDLLLATVEARLRQVARIRDARPAPGAELSIETLQARFALTAAEARVALALTEGLPVVDIAARDGTARTTVAFHLRNIFQKTHTGRQAELVALLLGGEAHGPAPRL